MNLIKEIINSIPKGILAIGGACLLIVILFLTFNDKPKESETATTEKTKTNETTVEKENTEEDFTETEETTTTNVEEETDSNTLSVTEKESIQNTVKNFSEAFYNLDSDKPTESIEKSKAYMTESLYNKQKDFRYQGNWNEHKIVYKDFDIDVHEEAIDDVYKVAVSSTGQAYDDNGKKTYEVPQTLLLDVVDENGKWLINDISFEHYE